MLDAGFNGKNYFEQIFLLKLNLIKHLSEQKNWRPGCRKDCTSTENQLHIDHIDFEGEIFLIN